MGEKEAPPLPPPAQQTTSLHHSPRCVWCLALLLSSSVVVVAGGPKTGRKTRLRAPSGTTRPRGSLTSSLAASRSPPPSPHNHNHTRRHPPPEGDGGGGRGGTRGGCCRGERDDVVVCRVTLFCPRGGGPAFSGLSRASVVAVLLRRFRPAPALAVCILK